MTLLKVYMHAKPECSHCHREKRAVDAAKCLEPQCTSTEVLWCGKSLCQSLGYYRSEPHHGVQKMMVSGILWGATSRASAP